MRLTKPTWIAITGIIWLITGVGLLTLGLHFIVEKSQLFPFETTSLIAKLTPLSGGREKAALALITIGLIVGFIKGRYVFVKTIQRVVARILQLPVPVKISQVYSKGYLILISCMILLGMSLKWLQLPQEIRGVIDVAIGSALMNGALTYFRLALRIHKELSKSEKSV